MNLFKKSNFLRVFSLVLLVIMATSLVACNSDEGATPDESTAPVVEFTLAIVKSDKTGNGMNMVNGFVDFLETNGYFDDENIKISYHSSEEAKPDYNALAKAAVGESPDLIYAVGTDAAKACAKATAEIPIIFAGVSDPIAAGLLKTTEKPDKNVTGVSNFIPVYQQLQFAKFLVPTSDNISVLYCEPEEKSILIASLIKEECSEFGLKFNPFTPEDKNELSGELEKALKDCDILYLPEDKLTKENIKDILKAAGEKKIPVFSSDTNLVNSGALATSIHDYKTIGNQAANMSLLVLNGSKQISEMPVYYPDKCINVVNEKTLSALGLSISPEESGVLYV